LKVGCKRSQKLRSGFISASDSGQLQASFRLASQTAFVGSNRRSIRRSDSNLLPLTEAHELMPTIENFVLVRRTPAIFLALLSAVHVSRADTAEPAPAPVPAASPK